MNSQSERVVASVLILIQQKVWEGVAVENIKKMAPQSARLQGLEALHSHVSNEMQNRERKGIYTEEKDPLAIPLDSLAIGCIQPEKQENISQIDVPQRKVSLDQTSSRIRQRKFTSESLLSKKFNETKKTEQTKDKEIKIIEIDYNPNEHFVFDEEEDKMRSNMFLSEKFDADLKKQVEEREKKREEGNVLSKKAFKDVKKFTFDYGGKFCTIGNLELGADKPAKIIKNDGVQNIAKKNDMKNPEQTLIENEKIKEKNTKKGLKNDNSPSFNKDRPESLLDLVKDQNSISEGVKFIAEKGSERVVKEKKRKALSGIKKYHLHEFKDMSKDSKFKEFRSKALNSISSSSIQVAQVSLSQPIQQEKAVFQQRKGLEGEKEKKNTQSEQMLKVQKAKDHYFILPPLRNKMFSKKGAYSHRTIEANPMSSRVSNKSKITIDDGQLFETNFRME